MVKQSQQEILKNAASAYNTFLLKVLNNDEEPVLTLGARLDLTREQINVEQVITLLEKKDVTLPTELYGAVLARALDYYAKAIESDKGLINSKLPDKIFFIDQEEELQAVQNLNETILSQLKRTTGNYDPSRVGKTYKDGF